MDSDLERAQTSEHCYKELLVARWRCQSSAHTMWTNTFFFIVDILLNVYVHCFSQIYHLKKNQTILTQVLRNYSLKSIVLITFNCHTIVLVDIYTDNNILLSVKIKHEPVLAPL